jgi:hypothetical protein
VKTRILSQASPCEICGGTYGTVASFAPNISVFSRQYNFTNDPYSPSIICRSYQEGKQANKWNFQESNALVGNRKARIEKYFHISILHHFSNYYRCKTGVHNTQEGHYLCIATIAEHRYPNIALQSYEFHKNTTTSCATLATTKNWLPSHLLDTKQDTTIYHHMIKNSDDAAIFIHFTILT